MRHADLLKLLLPAVAYDSTGVALSAEIVAEGTQLDVAQSITNALLVEIDPRSTNAMLEDWERVYGLPDGCTDNDGSIEQRRANLVAKVAQTGGLSKGYFLGLAAQNGYQDTTITTFFPTNCEMNCESTLKDELWRFLWAVNLPHQGDNHTTFRVGAPCDERLDRYVFGTLECQFMRLKPAHTQVIFTYKERADATN